MKVYIICPSKIATGGTELLHQFSFYLNENGIENYIVYTGETSACPTPERFMKYNAKYITEYVDDYDSVLVLPETQIHRCNLCIKGKIVIWWLSVDNYFTCYDAVGERLDLFNLRNRKNVIHFVQSFYAKDFVNNKLGIEECFFLQDYINDDIINNGVANTPQNVRKNAVLYNPRKGYEKVRAIMEECRSDIQWIPIINMSPNEISELMLNSKVYIDFGNHPGKDRIPREAAICGCNIITNRNGSAAYYEDVPIPECYKCSELESISQILEKLYDLIDNYDERNKLFSYYRERIACEKKLFGKQVFEAICILRKKNQSKLDDSFCAFDASKYNEMIDTMLEISQMINSFINDLKEYNMEKQDYISTMLQLDYYMKLIIESEYAIISDITGR